jgi:RHS repeat-associated protein
VIVNWPFGWTATQQQIFARTFWHGTLIEQKRDASGLLFRRNRYVDPATGRFTQEDPIGLGGGLNLYGFASGDPANFSDPFGLCPKDKGGDGATRWLSDCPEGSVGRAEWSKLTLGNVESAFSPLDLVGPGEIRAGFSLGARFLANVTVKSFGKVVARGTVDLGPSIERALAGRALNQFVHDGIEFKNAEGLLPKQAKGYYNEWVIPTQGVKGAGSQRLITGRAGEVYYTPDHYSSFVRVR